MVRVLPSLKREMMRLRSIIYHRIYIDKKHEKNIVDKFHKLYYDTYHLAPSYPNTFWLGVPITKCPMDCWIYQEIISDVKPAVIVESGTYRGGGAYFLACLCDAIGLGRVITIDIEEMEDRPQHKRITYLSGSSLSEEVLGKVKSSIKDQDRVLVILDSSHQRDHVLNELRVYSKLVAKGSYIIVEDTNLNGHPVAPEFGPGPMEAVDQFLMENKDFTIDKDREKLLLTWNPRGYLKKIR